MVALSAYSHYLEMPPRKRHIQTQPDPALMAMLSRGWFPTPWRSLHRGFEDVAIFHLLLLIRDWLVYVHLR